MLSESICSLRDFIPKLVTPSYVLYYDRLLSNLARIDSIQERCGARVLVALKGYSFWRAFDDLRVVLRGAACSGPYEARLAYEEIAGRLDSGHDRDICVFSPAFSESQMYETLKYATHIVFNSFTQWSRFKDMVSHKNEELRRCGRRIIEVGMRVNPLYSEVSSPMYNPCIPMSRLGVTPSEFRAWIRRYSELYGEEFFSAHFGGLHFHTHCEQDSHVLGRTLPFVEHHFGDYIKCSKWINFGGGHHLTRDDYDVDTLVGLLLDFKSRYSNIDVYLEPGEAIGWRVGDLFGSVVDIVYNGGDLAILDVSASNHMPDCLELPYRPECYKISRTTMSMDSDLGADVGAYRYRFGGPTCLSGDVIGDYSFDSPLCVGDIVGFVDMIHYTIVKNTTFNGVELPSLGIIKDRQFSVLKEFGYVDFKERN